MTRPILPFFVQWAFFCRGLSSKVWNPEQNQGVIRRVGNGTAIAS
jgi:hypothetical protein